MKYFMEEIFFPTFIGVCLLVIMIILCSSVASLFYYITTHNLWYQAFMWFTATVLFTVVGYVIGKAIIKRYF